MVFGQLYRGIKKGWNRILGRFPRRVSKFMKQKGDLVITDLTIKRDPILTVIDKMLNFLSLGQWEKSKKKYHFDELFHLRMIATLSNGSNVLIEKNQNINIIAYNRSSDTDKTESMNVPLRGKRITLQQLIDTTLNKVGEERFLEYDPFTTNCQRFILDILESNGLSSNNIKKFIYQDVSEMIEELPGYLKFISKEATDTASLIDRGLQWLGFKKGGLVKPNKNKNINV